MSQSATNGQHLSINQIHSLGIERVSEIKILSQIVARIAHRPAGLIVGAGRASAQIGQASRVFAGPLQGWRIVPLFLVPSRMFETVS